MRKMLHVDTKGTKISILLIKEEGVFEVGTFSHKGKRDLSRMQASW